MSSTPFNKIHLFQELQKWPLAELRTLCAYLEWEHPQLQVAYDNLAGDTARDKAQALISHLQRFERFDSWGHLRLILEAHFPFQDTSFFASSPLPPVPLTAKAATTNQSAISNPQSAIPPKSFIGIEWVEIPAGEFWMGDNAELDDQMPCHLVDLPTYWIAKTPITNAQYRAFVQATGYGAPAHWKDGQIPQGKGNHPVVSVSWDDGMALAKWAGEQMGQMILLPSEAEWEKAARGGLVLPSGKNPLPKRKYPWGDAFDKGKCNTSESGIKDTTPVNQYPQGASPYGVLEMSGNVWEWTRSLYKPYPYMAGDGREDLTSRNSFVVRGGSGSLNQNGALVSLRLMNNPRLRGHNLGVRLVCIPHFSGS
ncbi:MAG: SUMF1/EgtB/PvdO family nonheme iron enzyme [Chloroflexi bacterium]|nr:SUMF1/EgtB/PvdO family nonheme iron enzyme [Chloroflexota bacterium]